MKEKETRVWRVDLEVRAGEDADTIVGYAAVFDALSEDLGGFRERIAPGAFARSVKEENDVRALWEHNPQYVLGRTKVGTLRLEEDKTGLRVEINPPATMWAGDLMRSMRRGDVDQMSFGFYVRDEAWERDGEAGAVRTLKDVDLFDVSVVTYPAYPQTSAEARARAERVVSGQSPVAGEEKKSAARRKAAARRRGLEVEILREV